MLVKKLLPGFLVFLWRLISLSVRDFIPVPQAYAMEEMAREVINVVRKSRRETVGGFLFHVGVAFLETRLKS